LEAIVRSNYLPFFSSSSSAGSCSLLVLSACVPLLQACFGSSSGGPASSSNLGASSGGDASLPEDGGAAEADGGAAAFDLTALPAGAFTYSQGSYLEGFEFRAPAPVRVTQLGYFDASLAAATQAFAPSDVGLYDITTHTLLGTVSVEASDPAVGIYRFHALATPVALGASDTYAVVAVTGTDDYVSGFDYGGQLSPDLTWVGFAGYGANNLTQTTTLAEPNYFWTSTGNLGANFVFEKE
jgi:hypothetical protein